MFINKAIRKVKVDSTPFSDFIRNASSGEKKKVYKAVLQKASDDQRKIIEQAAAM